MNDKYEGVRSLNYAKVYSTNNAAHAAQLSVAKKMLETQVDAQIHVDKNILHVQVNDANNERFESFLRQNGFEQQTKPLALIGWAAGKPTAKMRQYERVCEDEEEARDVKRAIDKQFAQDGIAATVVVAQKKVIIQLSESEEIKNVHYDKAHKMDVFCFLEDAHNFTNVSFKKFAKNPDALKEAGPNDHWRECQYEQSFDSVDEMMLVKQRIENLFEGDDRQITGKLVAQNLKKKLYVGTTATEGAKNVKMFLPYFEGNYRDYMESQGFTPSTARFIDYEGYNKKFGKGGGSQ